MLVTPEVLVILAALLTGRVHIIIAQHGVHSPLSFEMLVEQLGGSVEGLLLMFVALGIWVVRIRVAT